jgi:hypothetical protein
MKSTVFIFHGTEGHPDENWFPWLKQELEIKGYDVVVPQFPSPPIVPAKLSEWFNVLTKYEGLINEQSIFIGHSLGGIFALRVLERLSHPIYASFFVGTPLGVKPILYFDRDKAFSGFDFNWEKIRGMAKSFVVYHSDDDPYVALGNGNELAKDLGVKLTFVPNAGHFNAKAGYTKFELLRDKLLGL